MPDRAVRKVALGAICLLSGALGLPAAASGVGAPAVSGTTPVRAAALPAGFVDAAVVSVPSALAVAALPDGRVLVSSQDGRIWLVRNRALQTPAALDLRSRICDNSERGLLGIAVDPDFAENRFVFVAYTFDRGTACPTGTTSGPVTRVSRFVMRGDRIDASTERVLIDGVFSFAGNHNGGDIHFGHDGLLYASFGDGGCDYRGDSGCQDGNDASRDRNVLLGKIARVTRNGDVPATNPFQGANSARCNAGPAPAGKVCQETFAWGLRNPFRFATARNGRIYVNDVGGSQWEEIDELRRGADYGWNVREGFCATGSSSNCGPPPTGMTNPISAYSHASGCSSITAAAFVPAGAWGPAFRGGYLYGDYTCNRIFLLRNGTVTTFASGLPGIAPISMAFVPEGGTQSLYYTDLEGTLRRITPPSTGNRAPTARLVANPAVGELPLRVTLDARGSSDPDADPLTYYWTWGDGTTGTSTDRARADHTYTRRGRFTASVRVSDGRGGLSPPATVEVIAGNTPPAAVITSPAADVRFSVGQTITLSALAVDEQDGVLAGSALSWRVIRHHASHTHPFLPPTEGNDLTFAAPSPESLDAAANSYLEAILTVTDSSGATAQVRRLIEPRKVVVTLRTDPSQLFVRVNGAQVRAPYAAVSWAGFTLSVDAFAQNGPGGVPYEFDRWSDGGAAAHDIVSPRVSKTYTATMRPA